MSSAGVTLTSTRAFAQAHGVPRGGRVCRSPLKIGLFVGADVIVGVHLVLFDSRCAIGCMLLLRRERTTL